MRVKTCSLEPSRDHLHRVLPPVLVLIVVCQHCPPSIPTTDHSVGVWPPTTCCYSKQEEIEREEVGREEMGRKEMRREEVGREEMEGERQKVTESNMYRGMTSLIPRPLTTV